MYIHTKASSPCRVRSIEHVLADQRNYLCSSQTKTIFPCWWICAFMHFDRHFTVWVGWSFSSSGTSRCRDACMHISWMDRHMHWNVVRKHRSLLASCEFYECLCVIFFIHVFCVYVFVSECFMFVIGLVIIYLRIHVPALKSIHNHVQMYIYTWSMHAQMQTQAHAYRYRCRYRYTNKRSQPWPLSAQQLCPLARAS